MGIVSEKGEDISGDEYKIMQADFVDMRERRDRYIQKEGKEPEIIYLPPPNQKAYVTLARMEELEKRYDKWTREHDNIPPVYITVNPTQPTRTVGPIQRGVEAKLGAFSNITQFYNKMIGRGYGAYYNDVKTLNQEIAALSNLNCADSTQLLVFLSREMGYTARFCHVYCRSGGGHIYAQVMGHELGDSWVKVDMAAAMSVHSKYPIGKVWCSDARISSYNDPWLQSDDAKT